MAQRPPGRCSWLLGDGAAAARRCAGLRCPATRGRFPTLLTLPAPWPSIVLYDWHADKIHDVITYGGEEGRRVPNGPANL